MFAVIPGQVNREKRSRQSFRTRVCMLASLFKKRAFVGIENQMGMLKIIKYRFLSEPMLPEQFLRPVVVRPRNGKSSNVVIPGADRTWFASQNITLRA